MNSAAAPARAKEIRLTLAALRAMKNLPDSWRQVVEETAFLPDDTTVVLTEERFIIEPQECL